MCVHIILVSFGLLSCIFWKRAGLSVDHMFSLYFDFLFRLGFEGWI